MGYITTNNTYNIGKIGTITLKEATMNLQKIVVKGHRQPFRMTSEGLVAQVEGTSLENGLGRRCIETSSESDAEER